jgi:hypothetical protein
MNKNGAVGDKAILKKTGKEVKIKKSWGLKTIAVSFDLDNDVIKDTLDKYKEEITFTKEIPDLPIGINNEEPKEWLDNWFYELDNGEKVTKDDVVTGTDNIRDYKINQINGIQ